jgi:hypothetical protein
MTPRPIVLGRDQDRYIFTRRETCGDSWADIVTHARVQADGELSRGDAYGALWWATIGHYAAAMGGITEEEA